MSCGSFVTVCHPSSVSDYGGAADREFAILHLVEVVVLVGAPPYALPERSAIELRDLVRTRAPDDRPLSYLADAISEDLEHGESPEPLDLGHEQIEALVEILCGAILDEPLQRLREACQRFAEP
jgi:hypothetical protein